MTFSGLRQSKFDPMNLTASFEKECMQKTCESLGNLEFSIKKEWQKIGKAVPRAD